MFYINNMIDPIVKLMGSSGDFLSDITLPSVIIRIFLAVILGGIVGLERAAKRHAAGLRTYILVCVGACVAMLTNQFLTMFFEGGDSARLAAQVVSGIGFLGAGTILISSRSRIKGLTTAAGLWTCACIGISIGSGFYTLGIAGTIIVMLVLNFLPKLEYFVRDHGKYIEYHVEFNDKDSCREFIDEVRRQGMIVQSSEFNQAFSSNYVFSYSFIIEKSDKDKRNHREIKENLSKLPHIVFIEELY